MIAYIIGAVCDGSGARRERSWYIRNFEIAETEGGGFVLCESVGCSSQVKRFIVPVRVLFDMGDRRPSSKFDPQREGAGENEILVGGRAKGHT